MDIKVIFLFLAANQVIGAVKKSYEGYKVYKVIPKTENEVTFLNEIKKNEGIEFWNDEVVVNSDVRMMVAPTQEERFIKYSETHNMNVTITIKDLQKLIDDQLQPNKQNSRNTAFLSYSWDVYHNLEEIYSWLDELESNYPDIVKTVVMGQSFEGRDIKGIIINHHPQRENNRIGMLEGTLHAREWISPATVTWIIKELLTSNDPEVRGLAENFEWHIFPVVNPDGYAYTFTHNRMWRKNRNTNNFISCEASGAEDDMSNGIDLNRNFDHVWMSVGASQDPCSNTYAGPTAFSEPESRAIADYVTNLKEQGEFIYYIAFHSYTQLIIIPYSHVVSDDLLVAENYGDLYEIAIRGAAELSKRYGTQYRVGASVDVMYQMSGASFDWVKYDAEVPIVYLLELRDLGEFGFILPPEQIVPNNLEVMDGLLEMDRTAKQLRYYSGSSYFLGSITILISGLLYVILLS